MAISMNPYLNFAGNAKEAMEFYQSVFGGELNVSTFGEFGMEGMPADGTMHASLVTEHFTVMASDAMPGAEETWGGTRNYISISGDDLDTLSGWFHGLAAGGNVGMPLEKQVWGDVFGIVMDQYGIEWMVNVTVATP
jgi:PhnB protein